MKFWPEWILVTVGVLVAAVCILFIKPDDETDEGCECTNDPFRGYRRW